LGWSGFLPPEEWALSSAVNKFTFPAPQFQGHFTQMLYSSTCCIDIENIKVAQQPLFMDNLRP
jgi:hypothetical protein